MSALEQAQQISLSGVFGRIPRFTVATELYEPALTAAALSDDREARDEQLRVEAARVRAQMMAMLKRIRAKRSS